MSDQVLVGLEASMLADGCYDAVRERLLQGLIYCTDPGYAQLGFPTSEEGGFFERPSNCPPLCDDTLVIPGLVHASVVLPSTNSGLETSFAPWKFALKGGIVQRRLSSRGSCRTRLACGSSAVVIRGLVIENRASFQDGGRGWQLLRPETPRLQFMLGMGSASAGEKKSRFASGKSETRGLLAFSLISRNFGKLWKIEFATDL